MAIKSIKLLCRKCGLEKPLDELRKDKRMPYGRDKICAVCSAYQSYWSKRDKRLAEKKQTYQRDRLSIRQRQRDGKYKLVSGQYDLLYKKQDGRCAICFGSQAHRPLSVDHCHKTKTVRGLLCDQCNLALGKFKDNEIVMLRAIRYLMKSSATYADKLEF